MTLRKSIWINAPVAKVRSYFTDGTKMSQWTGRSAVIDARPGGTYRLDMGEGGWLEGRFTEVNDGRICWEVDLPDGQSVSRIAVTFTDEAGGTRVDVVQSGLPAPFDLIASRGWDHHLARLSVTSTGGSVGRDSLCDRQMQSLA